MDGLGLVGRISGVGSNTARVLLLTDTSSRIPITTQPSGQRALVIGDNSPSPLLDFIESPDQVRPGDRILTSGDGGVFPAGLLVGQVIQDRTGRMRVRIAADYERLEFLRVLRSYPKDRNNDPGSMIGPAAGPRARAADQANAARAGDE
jgi:rod shape-determining protein MreC